VEHQKYERGVRLQFTIRVLFSENSPVVAFRHIKFVAGKDHGQVLFEFLFCLTKLLNMAMVRT
jgi:hypothetical protein